MSTSHKYPAFYPACETCQAQPGHRCYDLRSVKGGGREWMKHPHAGRRIAKTSQLPKRSLRQ